MAVVRSEYSREKIEINDQPERRSAPPNSVRTALPYRTPNSIIPLSSERRSAPPSSELLLSITQMFVRRLLVISRHLNPVARTMSFSEACCSIPAVQVDYTAKGTYITYGGFDRVYVTGDKTLEIGLIVVTDIFG